MYTVIHVNLRNCCQYDTFSEDVHTGLTAVVGRNGSGKTTLLRGIAYALTGLVDGSWGTQQNLQKDGSVVPGYAEVSFTDGTDNYAVRRFFTPSVKSPDVVEKNGKVIHEGRKKVNSFMDEVFGMPCPLMFQVCWGRQGELAYLLRSTPAMVSSFLAMLFDTRSMERLREKIKAQVDTIAALPSDCERQLEESRKELEAIPSDDDIDAQIAAKVRGIEAARRGIEALPPVDGMTLEERDSKVGAELMAITADEATLNAFIDELPIESELTADEIAKQLSEAQSRLDELNMQVSTAEAMKATHERSLQAVVTTLAQANDTVETVRAAIDGAHDRCPLCHSPIADSEEYEASAIAYLAPGYHSKDEFDRAMYESLTTLEGEVTRLQELVKGRQDAADAMRKEISELTAARDTLDKLSWQRRKEAIRADIQARRKYIEELKAMPVLDVDVNEKRSLLGTAIAYLDSERINLERSKSANEAKRVLLQRYIADYEKAVHQYQVNRDARQVLNDIRDALSQSRAQARYLKSRIELLNAHLRRYTALTAMPFTVRLDNSKRCFVYSTSDGVEHPAAHLSGAQQAMTAVALQMAIFAVANPSMNLYLIDEPTEACDDGNKEVMAQMFSRMNSMLETTSGVMLIVARDEQTLESCQNMMEVTNA